MIEQTLFEKYPETKIYYKNNVNNKSWEKWKSWKDCLESERIESNLRELFPNEIVLDVENKDTIEQIKTKLDEDKYGYYLFDSGSRGIHVHIFSENLNTLSEDIRTRIRKKIITSYGADLSKSSEHTLIAMCDKPHFKTMKLKILIELKNIESSNNISNDIQIEVSRELEKLIEIKENSVNLPDENFKNYFETDPFWIYISNHIINDAERNNVLFPNLAIACAKSGKSLQEIETIVKPVLVKNFPGKNWNEFSGWLKKAFDGVIVDYNLVQLNNWMQTYSEDNNQIYVIENISMENQLNEIEKDIPKISNIEIEGQKYGDKIFYSGKELKERVIPLTKWLIDTWIAIGDISFLAGKSASYKTTIGVHIANALSEGKLVFNKYNTTKSSVLYINEEMNSDTFQNLVNRVRKGLDLVEEPKDIFYSLRENVMRLDVSSNVNTIIKVINANNINVMIFDSYRRASMGKENDSDVQNAIFTILKVIKKNCGNLTIILIDHAKKDGADVNSSDPRDSFMRGSSDKVAFCDSAIGVKRRIGKNKMTIFHIKNRCGPEHTEKVLDVTNDNEVVYIYETGDKEDVEKRKSKPEECAESILSFLQERNLRSFKRSELDELERTYSHDTIYKGLRVLKIDGVLNEVGVGRNMIYTLNLESL